MQPYPPHLIPYSDYRIMEQGILASYPELFLIRHIDSKDVLYIGDTKILSPDCITFQSDHLKDLSCNLLGIFKNEDVYFGIYKEYSDKYNALWEEGTESEPPTENEYFKDEERGFYFFDINKLTGLTFTTPQGKRFHFSIHHTPTKCNFWHISIRVMNEEGIEVSSSIETSKSQKRNIFSIAKKYILEQAMIKHVESHQVIPATHYTKPKTPNNPI